MKQAIPMFMIIVTGLCITMLLLSGVFFLSDTIRDNSVKVDKQQRQLNKIQRDDMINFDGAVIKGDEVINIIKKFSYDPICIHVNWKSGSGNYNYSITGETLAPNGHGWKDAKKEIPPSLLYKCNLVYSDKGNITTLNFEYIER